MAWITFTLAGIALLLILIYSFFTASLANTYKRAQKKMHLLPQAKVSDDNLPVVTIQLPIYNEFYVVERLLQSVANIEYPSDKLQIQILDDSTDDTKSLIEGLVQNMIGKGLDVQLVHRENRQFFKAGALKEALPSAKGEFIAIFDADFVPQSYWLLMVVPYIIGTEIGMVQTKWGHLNRDESMLTQVQAMALDMHFTVEQLGRNAQDHFINFNGTAGLWRKECILDAGNWDGDTLTEDLDLSYRAQLKGWKFKYLENIDTPAELPSTINACRSQQHRWNKGGAENFQKFIRRVYGNKKISLKSKLYCTAHLLNSSLFLFILMMGLLSIPLLLLYQSAQYQGIFMGSTLFGLATIFFTYSYWIGYRSHHGGGFKSALKFIKLFVSFLCVAMGFSINNSIAVLLGHSRVRSDFVRTPKFNQVKKKNKYRSKNFSITLWLELLLILYFCFGIYLAIINYEIGFPIGLFIFMCMFLFGLLFVVYSSIFEDQ